MKYYDTFIYLIYLLMATFVLHVNIIESKALPKKDIYSPSLKLECNFDKGLCPGFTHDTSINQNFNWQINNGSTPSPNTGPEQDNTEGTMKGSYIYAESSQRLNGAVARFRTPVLFGQIKDEIWCLEFFYHMLGHTMGELSVHIYDVTNGFEDIKFKLTVKRNVRKWIKARFSFEAPTTPFQIVFQSKTSYSFYGDIAVDDIKLFSSLSSCFFWPPQAIPGRPPRRLPTPKHGPENLLTCGRQKVPTHVNMTNIIGHSPSMQRVIGGQGAKSGEWPWMAMLLTQGRYKKDYSARCGGTLLGTDWVITAAHCLADEPDKKNIKVRMGATKQFNGFLKKTDYDIDRIFIHDKYRLNSVFNYDVALIKLKRPVMFNDMVNSICLAESEPQAGEKCYIAGWGKITNNAEGDPYPKILQDGAVTIQGRNTCQRVWHGQKITSSMMCAGNDSGRPDTCLHDSGGPLMCHKNGKWSLNGITSWGSGGCGQPYQYGVYTRLSEVQDWVKTVIKYPNKHTPLHYE